MGEQGNSDVNSAQNNGEGSVDSPNAMALDGTVTNGLIIGVAIVFVAALIGTGSYLMLKGATHAEIKQEDKFVDDVMDVIKEGNANKRSSNTVNIILNLYIIKRLFLCSNCQIVYFLFLIV